MLTTRMIVLLVTTALGTGGAAWGVHALMGSAEGSGTDYGLDTNGNGTFDWLVVEAYPSLPAAGTWSISASLSTTGPLPTGSCGSGSGGPPPMPLMGTTTAPAPIAWVYERYFFPAGAQTIRMAFAGTDIARAGVDGPYAVHATFSLGDVGMYEPARPTPIVDGNYVERNYTTKAYAASQFEQPVRPAVFTGGHADAAVDVDSDGLFDFLELRADVRVNVAGPYSLNGVLTQGTGTDVVRIVAYAYRQVDLSTSDSTVFLRFRGDQIRSSGVDGPWSFTLTLYYQPYPIYRNETSGGIATILPPWPVFYPENLCGVTSAYRASDFDASSALLRYTGHFEELTPDGNGDGTYDALVIRAEVEVLISAGSDLSGVLHSTSATTEIARASGQVWLREGVQSVDFVFPGPEIRASRLDGPYEATLSIIPSARGIDPTTKYTTRAYRATDFDAGYTNGSHGYWIGGLNARGQGSALAISVSVVRGPDLLTVVIQDTILMTVTNSSGSIVGSFKDVVYLAYAGFVQSFRFALENVSRGTYTVTAVLGSPDRPVDTRTVMVTM